MTKFYKWGGPGVELDLASAIYKIGDPVPLTDAQFEWYESTGQQFELLTDDEATELGAKDLPEPEPRVGTVTFGGDPIALEEAPAGSGENADTTTGNPVTTTAGTPDGKPVAAGPVSPDSGSPTPVKAAAPGAAPDAASYKFPGTAPGPAAAKLMPAPRAAAEPKATEPKATEPAAAEPKAAEPKTAEPATPAATPAEAAPALQTPSVGPQVPDPTGPSYMYGSPAPGSKPAPSTPPASKDKR